MMIDIRGFNPQNLGSCLMLLAVQSRLRKAFPEATLSVRLASDDLPLSVRHRMRFQLHGRWPVQWRGLPVGWLGNALPSPLRQALWITPEQDCAAVVDISGFAYGDFWGPEKLQRRLGRALTMWHRQRQKLILLPQAFGPFTNGQLASGMRDVLNQADLVFPRDRVSTGYLSDLGVASDKLEQFPDFTHEVPGRRRGSYPAPKSYFCLIPNAKITVGRTAGEIERYERFFVDAASRLRSVLGVEPVVLRFGGHEDEKLVELLSSRIVPAPRCFTVADPRFAKGLIGSSVAVVSSRFHAVVSALGSSVPCLAVGWSHKYGEAMSEFDCARYSLSLKDPNMYDALDEFVGDVLSGGLHARLRAAAARQSTATDRMWDKVIRCIGGQS